MKTLTALSGRNAPSDAMEDEVDLNISPIMNVLIMLIPFLTSLAVYAHLSILELSLPPNVGSGTLSGSGKPKLKMTLVLHPEYIAVTYGEKMLDSLPKLGPQYDYTSLSDRLKVRREEMENKEEAVVAVRDEISFKYVVDVLDVCRGAGFSKTAVAGAAATLEAGK
ncbi:MAG: hypothetical protein A2293_12995 [Elusimicrobia bacterium RIFOXYB2_FULL_49_7]|nr:MAG: hypothetical protein A2293_12995 [Elusimicrobia bacterium RIFOXYB2_FULL_49_7]